VPDLHARRSRMRHGAEKARIAGTLSRHGEGRDPHRLIHLCEDRRDTFCRNQMTGIMDPRVRWRGRRAERLRRNRLRQIFVIQLILDRREGAERLGRERDRFAVAVG
jgi:hypothetical protein